MIPCSLPDMIQGDRIFIQRLTPEFAKELSALAQTEEPRISPFMPWVRQALTVVQASEYLIGLSKKWEEFLSFEFAIREMSSSLMIGGICIPRIDWANDRCEIGYWIASNFESRGFIDEALSLLEKTIFEYGFNRIEILCALNNPRSSKIPERSNYKYEGTLREWFKVNGQYQDMRLYAKIRKDIAA